MATDDQMREIALDWGSVDNLPLQFVNQMVAQLGAPAGPQAVPDGISLIFGCASPPILVGSPEAVARKVDELQSVRVQPLGRFIMSRDRAEELLQVLARSLAQYDEIAEAADHARA